MNNSGGPRDSFAYRPSVIDVIDIDGSGTALRLEPIRPSGVGLGGAASNGATGAPTYMMPRPRRTQDEIRALLARTTTALDKIVKIRESMEPFVDFKQFEKKPRSGSSHINPRTLSRTSSSLDDAPLAEGTTSGTRNHRIHQADSYGSANSEDPLGDRSTGSTESSSSSSTDETIASSVGFDSSRGDSHSQSPKRPSNEQEQTTKEEEEELSDMEDDDFSSGEELPPSKEARLERLKSVTIDFHEGLPTEFFMALARFLHSTVELKTRHSKFNFYKETFVGSDAVRDLMLAGFAEDQDMAVRYGNVLVRLGFIEHVSRNSDGGQLLHDSKESFYRFTKVLDLENGGDFQAADATVRMSINAANYRESVISRDSTASIEYDFSEASDEVHALVTDETLVILARVLHKLFERKNKLLYYKGFVGCFLGAEAVNVVRELRIATSLVDAVLIGQALLDEKTIEPIAASVTTFQDRYVFYRLTRVQS